MTLIVDLPPILTPFRIISFPIFFKILSKSPDPTILDGRKEQLIKANITKMDKTNQQSANLVSSILARIRNEDWQPEIFLNWNQNHKQQFYLILDSWTFCSCNYEYVNWFLRVLESCNYLAITKVPQTQQASLWCVFYLSVTMRQPSLCQLLETPHERV